MRIEAATLAGGEVNQDYYAYGDTYALVLDGASSFLPEKTSIDATTYVEALGSALAIRLEVCDLDEVPNVVAESIKEVVEKYELVEESSSNSTIVIAKWNQEKVVIYVLGDSTCLVIDNSGETAEITDNRMAQFGATFREKYKRRLSEGYGFDTEHKELLKIIQQTQKNNRNIQEGYWIAGACPEAGYNGILKYFKLTEVKEVLLCTDGGMSSYSIYGQNVQKLPCRNRLRFMIEAKHLDEEHDSNGAKNPRSKLHDDKTAILLDFTVQAE